MNEYRYRIRVRADRSQLLDNSLPGSGRSSPFGGMNGNGGGSHYPPAGQRFAEDLEGQNDEALEGLSKKVKLLKDVSTEI
jgi:blocked early in transport 1